MTAPISLREYFAAASSPYTKADAEVIGPQLEAMAEEGDVSERAIVDTSKSANSPLHRYFVWDNEEAGDKYRLHQASTMMKSIRVRVLEDNRPRVTPAYKIARPQPKAALGRGHNVLHGNSAAAVQKAKEAFDELASWRARYSPYVTVWADFAKAFGGVANQISEAEDVVRLAMIDDMTDDALTEIVGLVEALAVWRAQHSLVKEAWDDISDQATFVLEAINGAVKVFTTDQRAAQRKCLRCASVFQSGGVGNRLCERCAANCSAM